MMIVRFPILICCIVTFLAALSYSSANPRSLGMASRRANIVEDKRVKKQMWSQSQTNSMMNKSFPIEQWDKHFSSVGSKRAPISLSDKKDKQMFSTKTLDRKEVNFEMSRWNERMTDLHKKAGIEMDDRAHLVADRQLYYMMLQDSEKYSDLGDEVSLRELNRYQFRRNRPDGAVPVEKAGSGE